MTSSSHKIVDRQDSDDSSISASITLPEHWYTLPQNQVMVQGDFSALMASITNMLSLINIQSELKPFMVLVRCIERGDPAGNATGKVEVLAAPCDIPPPAVFKFAQSLVQNPAIDLTAFISEAWVASAQRGDDLTAILNAGSVSRYGGKAEAVIAAIYSRECDALGQFAILTEIKNKKRVRTLGVPQLVFNSPNMTMAGNAVRERSMIH